LELSFLLGDKKIINDIENAKKQVLTNKKNKDIINLLSPKIYKINNKKDKILEVENLFFSYDKKNNALENINISFYENEITSILGANGSGKSTLSLILSKALKPDKGNIKIKNNFKIGYIFQEASYQILCTKVKDEIAFGPRQLKIDQNKINQIVDRECERFNLNPDDNPINLSSEDLRKLTIGSILAIDSDIIIFDEPTNNLDENEINNLFEIILKLKEDRKTIIFISHDVHLSWKYSQRVILLNEGKLKADGDKYEIMKDENLLKSCNISVPEITKMYDMIK